MDVSWKQCLPPACQLWIEVEPESIRRPLILGWADASTWPFTSQHRTVYKLPNLGGSWSRKTFLPGSALAHSAILINWRWHDQDRFQTEGVKDVRVWFISFTSRQERARRDRRRSGRRAKQWWGGGWLLETDLEVLSCILWALASYMVWTESRRSSSCSSASSAVASFSSSPTIAGCRRHRMILGNNCTNSLGPSLQFIAASKS